MIEHFLPGVLRVAFCINRDDGLFANAAFAYWAKQCFFWLVHPLVDAGPAIQVAAGCDYWLSSYLVAYIALKLWPALAS